MQRNAGEKNFGIKNRIDRHAGLAHVADDARVIGVVAAVRRQVEGDRQTFLPHRQITAVEGITFFGGRKAGVLADRPGTLDIHRRVGAAQVGRQASQKAEVFDALDVGLGI